MLSWYHNETQESAGHVQFHGRRRVRRCFRCGSDSSFCGGTVFVGLREDNVTLLSKVSCLSRTQKALGDGIYVVGAFEVSNKHSSIIGMNAQFFVQQVHKVLSSFSIIHCYHICIPSNIFCSVCKMYIDIKSGHASCVLPRSYQEAGQRPHTYSARKAFLILVTKLPNSKPACLLYPARRGAVRVPLWN